MQLIDLLRSLICRLDRNISEILKHASDDLSNGRFFRDFLDEDSPCAMENAVCNWKRASWIRVLFGHLVR